MIRQSGGGGVSHAACRRVARSVGGGRRRRASGKSMDRCGWMSGGLAGRCDGMGLRGEWHAGRCPGLSIRTLHAAPMTAAEATAAQPRPPRSVGRSVVASFVGSLRVLRQSAGGSVGHRPSAMVSRDHTSFVRVVWMEAARRPKRQPVWSSLPSTRPRAPPSLFILGTKRKMDRRFQQSRRKEHKKGTRTRGGGMATARPGSRCEWGN